MISPLTPIIRDEVFRTSLEQAENFKKNSNLVVGRRD